MAESVDGGLCHAKGKMRRQVVGAHVTRDSEGSERSSEKEWLHGHANSPPPSARSGMIKAANLSASCLMLHKSSAEMVPAAVQGIAAADSSATEATRRTCLPMSDVAEFSLHCTKNGCD
jgi:hypothetical protein